MPQFADEVVGLLIRFLVVQLVERKARLAQPSSPKLAFCFATLTGRAGHHSVNGPRRVNQADGEVHAHPLSIHLRPGPLIGMSHEVFADFGRTTNQRCFGIR
jgi:hypothetical protein